MQAVTSRRKRVAAVAVGGLVAGTAVVVLALPGSARITSSTVVPMIDTNGNTAGRVTLSFTDTGQTIVKADIRVPKEFAGFHGFHVHSRGVCDPNAVNDQGVKTPFFSAGGHLGSTYGQSHGGHDGDMVPVFVTRDGTSELTFRTDHVNRTMLKDADGSAIIFHALPDNFANVPTRYAPNGPDDTTKATGDAGGRVACGVVP